MQLINALSACVISARMPSHHRQWSAQQLAQSLEQTSQPAVLSARDNQVQTRGTFEDAVYK
jgi:E3 ubiquitin-protein ligase HERC1